jgi:hypothetical protein
MVGIKQKINFITFLEQIGLLEGVDGFELGDKLLELVVDSVGDKELEFSLTDCGCCESCVVGGCWSFLFLILFNVTELFVFILMLIVLELVEFSEDEEDEEDEEEHDECCEVGERLLLTGENNVSSFSSI